jgi:hypothetical protein
MRSQVGGMLALMVLGFGFGTGAEPLRSGPQVGEKISGSFDVHNCNGADAGDTNCLV